MFSFCYKYSYTISNCIGNCGASSDAELFFLPVNDGCGAWMVPLTDIRLISGIARQKYNDPLTATITFADGRTSKAQVGNFGGDRLTQVRGQSALGKSSLDIEKVGTITILHDRNILPLPDQRFEKPDTTEAMALVCKDGAGYTLANASFLSVGDNGWNTYRAAVLKVKGGESNIDMESGRLKGLALKPEPNKESKYSLTTSTGDSIDVEFLYPTPYVGGIRDGRFAYVSVKDLKQLTVTPK